ncbi:MAG: phosphoserine phosphatase SerB, partial [Hyphomicrobiaceae bacterium]
MPKTPSDTLSFALVLTSAPGRQSLTDAHRAAARAELAKFQVIEDRWLAPSEAAEILFAAPDNLDTRALAARITAALGTAPIDVNIVPDDMNYRRKQLLIADMDSTIIEQECIDEMADVLGLKDKIAAITERAMRGELQFEDALRSRLALLKGISEADLQNVFETRLTLMPGA